MVITASVATPESDREIQFREWQRGHNAALEGASEDTCPWSGGLCEQWWRDGFNFRNFPPDRTKAQNL
jgi:ribosome modulation factor